MTAQVLAIGEALVDFIPEQTVPLSRASRFVQRPGGAPANIAVGLARLDIPVALATCVGADPFGELLVRTLTNNGVDTSLVRRSGAKTPLAFLTEDESVDVRFIFYYHGTAATRLRPTDVPADEIATASWVHFGSVSLSAEPIRSATLAAVEHAVANDVSVSFDPNLRPELWTDRETMVGEVNEGLEYANLLKVSDSELSVLTGTSDPEQGAHALADRGPAVVLVTLGSKGCYVHADPPFVDTPVREHVSGIEVTTVDTTGAGDAFLAGTLAALATETPLERAVTRGCATAALSTTAVGALGAFPTTDQLTRFMSEHQR